MRTRDYQKILAFYGERSSSPATARRRAEQLLATKLCRCIKKVRGARKTRKAEAKAIAICSQAVLTNKGLRRTSRLRCGKTARVQVRRNE